MDTVEVIIQVNGKLKAKMNVANGLDRTALEEAVKSNADVKAVLDGKNIVKVVAVPDKLVNFVVK